MYSNNAKDRPYESVFNVTWENRYGNDNLTLAALHKRILKFSSAPTVIPGMKSCLDYHQRY